MTIGISSGTIGYGTAGVKIVGAGSKFMSVKVCNTQATMYVGAGTSGGTLGAFPVLNNTTIEFDAADGLYAAGTANGTISYFLESK